MSAVTRWASTLSCEAAAVDMYVALQCLVDAYENGQQPSDYVWSKAVEAIAKAKQPVAEAA